MKYRIVIVTAGGWREHGRYVSLEDATVECKKLWAQGYDAYTEAI